MKYIKISNQSLGKLNTTKLCTDEREYHRFLTNVSSRIQSSSEYKNIIEHVAMHSEINATTYIPYPVSIIDIIEFVMNKHLKDTIEISAGDVVVNVLSILASGDIPFYAVSLTPQIWLEYKCDHQYKELIDFITNDDNYDTNMVLCDIDACKEFFTEENLRYFSPTAIDKISEFVRKERIYNDNDGLIHLHRFTFKDNIQGEEKELTINMSEEDYNKIINGIQPSFSLRAMGNMNMLKINKEDK